MFLRQHGIFNKVLQSLKIFFVKKGTIKQSFFTHIKKYEYTVDFDQV